MDWSKAKNILILALIATNIFLLFTYFSEKEDDNKIVDRNVLFNVLEEKNIFIDTKIPDKYEKMPAIRIKYKDSKQELIEKNLSSDKYEVTINADENEYRESADNFLNDCDIYSKNLLFDNVTTKDNYTVVKYKNSYRQIVIANSYIEVTFFEGKIKDVTRELLTIVPKKKLEIIAPEEALLMFMSENNSNEKLHVEKMQLVFWINDSSFNGEALVSDTAFPTWQIVYNDGMVKYINAYKG